MLRGMLTRLAVAISLCATSSLGQYPGDPGTPGAPGSPGSASSPGGYKGYGSRTGIAIGAAAAAGAGIGFLALHNRGKMVGCVERSDNGETAFVGEKDKKAYAVINGGSVHLNPGERLKLKGQKIKASSGKLAFEVREVAKNYGPCKE